MGPLKFLTDSNAAIDYFNAKLPLNGMDLMDSIVDGVSVISVITQIEILGYAAPAEDEAITQDFVNSSLIIDLNHDIVDKTIDIRKNFKTKTPDAIIAATSLVFRLDTCNEKYNRLLEDTRFAPY